MGIGLILVVPQTEKEKVAEILNKYPEFKMYEIGQIISGNKKVVFTN
jgi:phosphoribosylaminoimidazole (AIR) synthetase